MVESFDKAACEFLEGKAPAEGWYFFCGVRNGDLVLKNDFKI